MDRKLLYAATVAVSVISTAAMADAAPATRAQVNAEVQQARVAGTQQRTDYDSGAYRAQPVTAGATRAEVVAAIGQARADHLALVGPFADERYNPYGSQVLATSTLARSEVRNEVLVAAASGTPQRTDYDDAASVSRKAKQHAASVRFAQRLKARSSRDAG